MSHVSFGPEGLLQQCAAVMADAPRDSLSPSAGTIVWLIHDRYRHRVDLEGAAGQLARALSSSRSRAWTAFRILWFEASSSPGQSIHSGGQDEDLRDVEASVAGLGPDLISVQMPMVSQLAIHRWPWSIPYGASFRKLIAAVRTADALHLNDFCYLAALVAYAAARWYGTPILISYHGEDWPERRRGNRRIINALYRWLGRLVFNGARQVIFTRATAMPLLLSVKPNHGRGLAACGQYRSHGIDIHSFRNLQPQERAALRQADGVRPQQPLLLFVGGLTNTDGLSVIQALARAHPDLLIWVATWTVEGEVCPVNWSLPNVRVLSQPRGASLARLYQVVDLLVLPLEGEAFPWVVQEAMACGTPALVTPRIAADTPDVDDSLILQCPLDRDASVTVGDWARAIRRWWMLADRPLQRLSVAEFARRHWSLDVVVQRYSEDFRRMLARPLLHKDALGLAAAGQHRALDAADQPHG